MTNWNDYENKFSEIAPSFKYSRLDIQWGDSGEHFRIAGGADKLAIQRFELLAQKAGEELTRLNNIQEYLYLMDERNPLTRWYKALWKLGDNFDFGFVGNMLNENKETVGHIMTGSINRFVETSALLCLRFSSQQEVNNIVIPKNRSPLILDNLHPSILKVSKKLYEDGHYRAAVLDAYIELINRVKRISNRPDLDGSSLMQQVFSLRNPTILLSEDNDEQQGFMWLFSGAVMAIRNPKAHKITEITDPQRSLEWLAFASVLHRVLDDVENGVES